MQNKVFYDKDKQLFWVSELGLAATLMLNGYSITQVDLENPAQVAFGFRPDLQLNELVEKYWNKEMRVEPQIFQSQLVMLRKRINQELNN